MKICISGPRDYFNYDVLCEAIKASGFEITEVVSGGAKGVDQMGERWAKENGLKCTIFEAEWDNFDLPGCIIKERVFGGKRSKYNAGAGFYRNRKMAEYMDAAIVIALNTPGSTDMIKAGKEAGKPVFDYDPENHAKDEDYGYTF